MDFSAGGLSKKPIRMEKRVRNNPPQSTAAIQNVWVLFIVIIQSDIKEI